MRAMILAAGKGTRLRPYTRTLPKPLLPVGRHPLIYYNLLLLKKYGITDVVINLHTHASKLKKALGDGLIPGMRITYSEEPTILGTGGALRPVRRLFSESTFILMNGDILADLNLDKLVEFHQRKKAAATLVLRKDPDAERWGVIEADGPGRVWRLLKQGADGDRRLSEYMFTGVQVLEPRIFDYLPRRRFFSIIEAYQSMIPGNERVYGYVMRGFWMDLGTPERYRKAHRDMARGLIKLHHLP